MEFLKEKIEIMKKISVLKGEKEFSEFYPGSIAMISLRIYSKGDI